MSWLRFGKKTFFVCLVFWFISVNACVRNFYNKKYISESVLSRLAFSEIQERSEPIMDFFGETTFSRRTAAEDDAGSACWIRNDHSNKTCNVRGMQVPRRIWNHWTGFYCYNYTNSFRLNFRYNATLARITCDDQDIRLPVTVLSDDTFFWYDFNDTRYLAHIKNSFKTEDFFNMWLDCCNEATDCCDNFMDEANIYPGEKFSCPAIWDGWSCFPPAKAGTITKRPCSGQAYSTSSKVCVLESEKECFSNGTWNQQTNYEVCALAPILRARHNFHVIVLSVAIALSFPAVIIFLSFRKLRITTRFCLHRNLLLIIIIRNVLTITSKEVIILDTLRMTGSNHVMQENGVPCRVLAFFENAAKNGIYACMLVDGFYLHKLIVRAFANEPKIGYLYGTVVVLSLLPSLIWASVRGARGAVDCWMVDDTNADQWIPDGFRLAILAINLLLLLDIIRVMVSKLKMGSTNKQMKTTFRATLFLLPLFGIPIIITANRDLVTSDTCYAESIFFYFSYSIEASQGIVVAILFCYVSAEVHTEIRNGYRKFCILIQQKYGIELRRDSPFRRRTTAATYVDQGYIDEENRANYKTQCEKRNPPPTPVTQNATSCDKNDTNIGDSISARVSRFIDEEANESEL